MNKLVLKAIAISIAVIASLTSCDSEPTLQSYIVDSGEKEGFISTSVPVSILGIDDSKFTADSQVAYNSVEKVNFLMYRKTDKNEAAFQKESETLQQILKNDKYKMLMTHNQDGIKAKFLYQGDKDSIDEIIVFGTMDDVGMGVARILGDDMNVSKIMKMMKEMEGLDIDPAGMKGILNDMGIDTGENGEIDQEAVKAIMESKGIDTSEMEIN